MVGGTEPVHAKGPKSTEARGGQKNLRAKEHMCFLARLPKSLSLRVLYTAKLHFYVCHFFYVQGQAWQSSSVPKRQSEMKLVGCTITNVVRIYYLIHVEAFTLFLTTVDIYVVGLPTSPV